jgi:hypothetical protein
VRPNTALDIFGLEFQVPESRVKGETVDISTIDEYRWYEWVKYRETAASFPVYKTRLGRDLGAAIDIGPAMSRKILKANGQGLYRTSIISFILDEIQSPNEIAERLKFDTSVEEKLGKVMLEADFKDDPDFADFVTPTFEPYEDDEVPAPNMPDIDDVDNYHYVDTYDQYVGAQVRVPIGGEIRSGKVTRRKRELDGTWKGPANVKPMLDSRTYETEFPDGRSDEYTANVISENMYAQCDTEGKQFNIMNCITDHKKDGHSLKRADMYIKHGINKQVRKTTKGWHLCVEWKDGTTSWERLADLKESNPIDVAEYAVGKNLEDAPAFVWWVPHVLKKRSRIIAAVTKRYHKRTHKFVIEVPKSWDDCVRLDKENDNTLWQDAVRKEMNNVRIEFQILNDDGAITPTYQEIHCHMIFYVKMEEFRRKVRFVAGGHTTYIPHAMMYEGCVA